MSYLKVKRFDVQVCGDTFLDHNQSPERNIMASAQFAFQRSSDAQFYSKLADRREAKDAPSYFVLCATITQ